MSNNVKVFKWIAGFEGISFLVLLFIAMPLKYGLDMSSMVRYVGMAHGALFIAYIYYLIKLKFEDDWSYGKVIISCAASIVPFGTFYIDKKYLRS